MKSIDIVQFKCDIEGYIAQSELPMEVKRMALVEILDKVTKQARQEVSSQIEEREKENGSTDQDEI